jgi:coenzyme F420-reducing hydrogenase delta subunit
MSDEYENGYAMSLRQMADWVQEALDPESVETQRIRLEDIDTDELNAAADEIEALEAEIKRLRVCLHHYDLYAYCMDSLKAKSAQEAKP